MKNVIIRTMLHFRTEKRLLMFSAMFKWLLLYIYQNCIFSFQFFPNSMFVMLRVLFSTKATGFVIKIRKFPPFVGPNFILNALTDRLLINQWLTYICVCDITGQAVGCRHSDSPFPAHRGHRMCHDRHDWYTHNTTLFHGCKFSGICLKFRFFVTKKKHALLFNYIGN